MASLGERIATQRKAKGLTQEALAEKCSVTAQAVSKWENDLTAPDISLFPRLSEILGVTCDELLGIQRAQTVAVSAEAVDFTKMLLKVRVLSSDGDKVNLNLPLSIAELLIKNKDFVLSKGGEGKAWNTLQGIDFEQIISLVKNGVMGKLVEIESSDGDKVEVWVE